MDEKATSLSQQSTGIVRAAVANRNMKCFAIPENELKLISWMNVEALIYASLASFFLSTCLTILFGAAMEHESFEGLGGMAKGLVYIGAPVCGAVSLVFFVLLIAKWRNKNSMLDTIKRESVSNGH